jgi:xanthine dehydrogenase small subunit
MTTSIMSLQASINAPLPAAPAPSSAGELGIRRLLDASPARLRFWHRGQIHSVEQPAPHTTLLDFLRIDRGDVAVKEACAQGDCGACAVVAARLDDDGQMRWGAINACIKPLAWIHGKAVFSARDLPPEHPVIRAMLAGESSQCGFCTPGFVMALFAAYQEARFSPGEAVFNREQVLEAISGNLCRCTGYLPIIEAGLAMLQLEPALGFDRELDAMRSALLAEREEFPDLNKGLTAILQRRAETPEAWVVAGATDLGLRITKGHERPVSMIDVSGVSALRSLHVDEAWLTLGAALDLQTVFDFLAERWPLLREYLWRFAGRPIRNSATLGGNLGTASPIGDAIPLLMVLQARVQLLRWDARVQRVLGRSLAAEDFILGYRQTALAPDELITAVQIPTNSANWQVAAWKVSKRYEDDISAVSLAVAWRSDQKGRVAAMRLAAGGVADRALRLHSVENFLLGMRLDPGVLRKAGERLKAAIAPISDARASAAYRREVCANLLLRLVARA